MKSLLPLLTIILSCAAGMAETKVSQPNIVLIIADDHAFNGYGFMGHETVKTPNLDRMAGESLLYTRGYVMPVCSPSLACLLTGKLPRNNGITGNDLAKESGGRTSRHPMVEKLLGNSLILPKALKDTGYLTLQTGKLWNTTYQEVGFTHGMTDKEGRHGGDGLTIGRETMKPIYDFIDTAQQDKKPFFVWYAPMLPHDPHNPPEEILKKYVGKGPTPAAEKYFAMIEWFDKTCGDLDDYLTKKGLKDDTVILYLSDNGWNAEQGYLGGRAKMTPYEMGVRTPMFVRWPNKVKPHRDDETLASIIDFPTTILKIANIEIPKGLPGLDLTDRKAMAERKSVFVEAYNHDIADLNQPSKSLYARTVINGWSKLIIPGTSKPTKPFHTIPTEIELYDLKADPLEAKNLAKEKPEEVKRLMAIQDAEWDGK